MANPDTAKFCGNCGTLLGTSTSPPQSGSYPSQAQYQAPPPYQASGPYRAPSATPGGSTMGRKIGLGCLIALIVFLFFGLSCTRACFGLRHTRVYQHRRY
ncbi:MAG: hypothetical protein JO182_23905 [Acidobacteriaceae bacterium]|nr:hypothetical protein [Acidobacteriaceae bacterium]MBV9037556.1 hypothetical protein [Acidobacteriaceae bacterium]MBV9306439.1 hypothetical protein [Acidobacteriaceae bacterium]MBV9938823.1 hypothetical protein [Acidobacteriaceae bacterium]